MNDDVKTLFAHVKGGERFYRIVDVIKWVGEADRSTPSRIGDGGFQMS